MKIFPLTLIPNDTRIDFMRMRWVSLAIAALTASEESVIQDTDCIETSFPDFHASLLRLTGQR